MGNRETLEKRLKHAEKEKQRCEQKEMQLEDELKDVNIKNTQHYQAQKQEFQRMFEKKKQLQMQLDKMETENQKKYEHLVKELKDIEKKKTETIGKRKGIRN